MGLVYSLQTARPTLIASACTPAVANTRGFLLGLYDRGSGTVTPAGTLEIILEDLSKYLSLSVSIMSKNLFELLVTPLGFDIYLANIRYLVLLYHLALGDI